jgi:hypothetical protein
MGTWVYYPSSTALCSCLLGNSCSWRQKVRKPKSVHQVRTGRLRTDDDDVHLSHVNKQTLKRSETTQWSQLSVKDRWGHFDNKTVMKNKSKNWYFRNAGTGEAVLYVVSQSFACCCLRKDPEVNISTRIYRREIVTACRTILRPLLLCDQDVVICAWEIWCYTSQLSDTAADTATVLATCLEWKMQILVTSLVWNKTNTAWLVEGRSEYLSASDRTGTPHKF